MNDELLALANSELIDVNVKRLNGHIETADALRGWEREASAQMSLAVKHIAELRAALRLSAQQREPVVRVKELEWEDADEGMCTKWRACALGGHYELVALDGDGGGLAVNFYWGRPLSFWFIQGEPDEWGPTGPKMFLTLDAAKSAAQADYEQRIRSALVNAPVSASDGAMREALEQIRTVCIDNAGDTVRHDLAIKFIGKIASRVLSASEATKSDGGMKIPFGAMNDDPSAPGFKPVPSDLDARLERLQDEATDLGYVLTPEPEHPDSPHASDTRPADVTATPRVTDNDRDEIVVTRDGKELRGWSYSTEQERRVKMLCAREFVEGFHAGRQP